MTKVARRPASVSAETAFLARLVELGAALAPGATYVAALKRVQVICSAGHACSALPASVQQGHGVCARCSQADQLSRAASVVAKAKFLVRVAEQGAALAPDAIWLGGHKPIAIICANGHICTPHPSNVRAGHNLCMACVGHDTDVAEAAFLARIAELGATLTPGATWRGVNKPIQLICAQGHRCNPRPASLQQGRGVCKQCPVVFDRMYLVLHPISHAIKVGIASNGGRVRSHVGRGYQMVEQWQGLKGAQAKSIEQGCIAWWRTQGWLQVAAAPELGRTETTSSEHLPETLAWLTSQLTVSMT